MQPPDFGLLHARNRKKLSSLKQTASLLLQELAVGCGEVGV